jgi:predicted TIM-barrel enzyme
MRHLREAGERLVGCAVGSGSTAAASRDGGADFLLALSAGHFRVQGAASSAALLPFANANQLTREIALRHVLPAAQNTPVFLGLCAQDPTWDFPGSFELCARAGMVGITNFPSVGFIDGIFREALEEADLGYAREVALVADARKRGLMTVAFAFTPAEAAAMTRAGCDFLLLNLGWADWKGARGDERPPTLDTAFARVTDMIRAAKAEDAAIVPLVMGGPLVLPRDTAELYERTAARGYVAGSAIERLPADALITQAVQDFKHAQRPRGKVERLGAMASANPLMRRLFETIRRAADSEATILITGESGTGKELAARELHRLGRRAAGPLVTWNCAATTESLAMSELFGHERGAFTGASRTHVGKFEAGRGGTLFMDEVADLPLSVQAALLRVMQQKEIVRVGGEQTIAVDVRLVAATNRPFAELVPDGSFRLDLYYRLSTVVIRLPALRERREDIPLLIEELMQELSQVYGHPAWHPG